VSRAVRSRFINQLFGWYTFKVKTVIFDFDGTIADSFAVVVAIFHELTHRSQLVMPEEIVRLRKMRLLDVAREEHISGWRIPYLILLGRRRMTKRLSEVQVFGGMSDTIKNLQDDGYQLFIMSSNSTANVRRFLQQRELSKYFTNVYGGVGLFGKARALRKVLYQNHLTATDCVYIGDEPRDIEASESAGMGCIAVSWGFNAAQLLREHQPVAVVNTPEKLLSTIREKMPISI
jgi:phosphoglycolate phosphatase